MFTLPWSCLNQIDFEPKFIELTVNGFGIYTHCHSVQLEILLPYLPPMQKAILGEIRKYGNLGLFKNKSLQIKEIFVFSLLLQLKNQSLLKILNLLKKNI